MTDYCTDKDHTRTVQPSPTSSICYYCGKKLKPTKVPLVEKEFKIDKGGNAARTTLQNTNHGPFYLFSLSATIVWGTAIDLYMQNRPWVTFRPRRMFSNAPRAGDFLVRAIQASNVAPAQMEQFLDAHMFYGRAGMIIDSPIIPPANNIRFEVHYNGYIPPGFVHGSLFTFVIALRGRSV